MTDRSRYSRRRHLEASLGILSGSVAAYLVQAIYHVTQGEPPGKAFIPASYYISLFVISMLLIFGGLAYYKWPNLRSVVGAGAAEAAEAAAAAPPQPLRAVEPCSFPY